MAVAGRLREIDAERRPPSSVAAQAPMVVAGVTIDYWLFAAVLGLLAIGTLEIYSSSSTYALKKYGDSLFFFKRQCVFMTMGFVAMWLGNLTGYRWLKRWTYPLLFAAFMLLIAVLLFGGTINGARRWFILGPLSIQPVELAKPALICYLAYSLSKKSDKVRLFSVGFVPHLLVCSAMMILLLKQPDMGSSIILAMTTLSLLFIAGTKLFYIVLALLVAAPLGYQIIVGTWRLHRFLAYLNPDAYRQGAAYQIVQSQIAIGSGGLSGSGLGHGRQQLGYMPEGHSDFIIAGIGEEFGFLGFLLVLSLIGVLIWRGVRAAEKSRDAFGSYLAFGISIVFVFQTLIHTGVALGALPAKGLTFPFVSYGGSSLVVSMYLIGVLFSIGRNQPRPPRKSRNRGETYAKRHRRRVRIAPS